MFIYFILPPSLSIQVATLLTTASPPPTQQPHDAIDLTDNDIQVLGNFPLSPRVRTLLLARNRIAAVQPSLPAAVPNLRNLVLAGNSLGELGDLDVLARFARLTHLVLVDNPVTKKEVCFFGGLPSCKHINSLVCC
jgi:hypothetical protein